MALVITAPGINCDLELIHAFDAAGAAPEAHLLRELIREPSLIDRAELIGLPGGFSYGDDIGAGRIMAQLIRQSIYPALAAAIDRGVPMICPCNGFQIAVQCGLLPGSQRSRDGEAHAGRTRGAPTPTVALAENEDARFHDRWTAVEIPAETRCLWTRGLGERADQHAAHAAQTARAPGATPAAASSTSMLPNAHGEGRFVTDAATLESLERHGQIALRYADSENFNGSMSRVAGICDPSGLVLGLMPHPERFTRWTQHPWWTRLDPETRRQTPLGLAMFQNAVDWVRSGAQVGARMAPSARQGAQPCS